MVGLHIKRLFSQWLKPCDASLIPCSLKHNRCYFIAISTLLVGVTLIYGTGNAKLPLFSGHLHPPEVDQTGQKTDTVERDIGVLHTVSPADRPKLKTSGSFQASDLSLNSSTVAPDATEVAESSKETLYNKALKELIEKLLPFSPVSRALGELTRNSSEGVFDDIFKQFGKDRKTVIADIFRLGGGLAPYRTERGEEGWIENGVVYRPYRPPEKKEEYPSPYQPEVEPYVPYNHETFFEGRPHPPVEQTNKKIILWWIKTRYAPPMPGLEPMRFCPDFPCVMTSNRNYTQKSSAMVFAGDLIKGKLPTRRPEQVMIYSNHEPPCNWFGRSELSSPRSRWNKVFNWTMTYRLDSDVTSLYGITRLRRFPIHRDYPAIMANKTKMVAWIVSNCQTESKREKYVNELNKYIPVDIYGGCGKLKCPRSNDDDCFQMVNRTYKFYLSFESSFCTDYISEKFFRYLAANTITVARASNDFYAHAPPEIFLNTADFPSPKALAERMLHLANNDEEYINMLKEKDKYIPIYEDYPIRNKDGSIRYMHYHYEAVAFCEICQRLWNIDKYAKTVPDLKTWMTKRFCHEPKDLKF